MELKIRHNPYDECETVIQPKYLYVKPELKSLFVEDKIFGAEALQNESNSGYYS